MTATAAGPTILDILDTWVTGKTFKAMLVDSTFVHDKHADAFRADVTGEIIGTGYTAGGVALTGVATQQDTTNSRVEIVAEPAAFGTLTAADIAALIVYVDTGNAATDRILGVHEFTSQAPTGQDFTIAFNDDDSAPATAGVIGTLPY